MLDTTQDTRSLTDFQRSPTELIEHLRKTQRPVVLTIEGKPAAVVQDAEAYQRLLDLAALADAEEGIRLGLDDVANGHTRPAQEFFVEFEAQHGIRS